MLLKLMTSAPDSVRRVVSRAIGQSGFENFWQRFDRLDKPTRKQAGKAMLKILPDALQRLQRRLAAGPMEQRLKAMQMAHELELGEPLKETILQLCTDANPRLRSKAVAMSATVPASDADVLVDRLINDTDAARPRQHPGSAGTAARHAVRRRPGPAGPVDPQPRTGQRHQGAAQAAVSPSPSRC